MRRIYKYIVLLICAWIHWSAGITPGGRVIPWQPFGAYNTKEECERELARTSEQQVEMRKRGWQEGGLCLPDTVDPRKK